MVSRRSSQHAGKQPLVLSASLPPRKTQGAPPLTDLLDKELFQAQCTKAIEAHLAHTHSRAQKRPIDVLFETEERLELIVTVKRVAARAKIMPIPIRLPHPLLNARDTPVCLFVKDPQKQYKDLLDRKHIGFIAKVVGVSKLKGKYKSFEAKRHLCRAYQLFLVDDNVLPMMPKLLGRNWIEAKKQPIPIALSRTDLKAELERAISSTYLHIGTGTCINIRVGYLQSHHCADLVDNILAIVPQLAVRLPQGGWGNVQSLALKTSTSVALPIWTCLLDTEAQVATSRFFNPPWTIDPPHLSKRGPKIDWAAVHKELIDTDDEHNAQAGLSKRRRLPKEADIHGPSTHKHRHRALCRNG